MDGGNNFIGQLDVDQLGASLRRDISTTVSGFPSSEALGSGSSTLVPAPLGAAAFEVSWNNAPFAFDFDYGATFVGFLAYKFALSTVLYQTVREMMIGDSETFYDTEEKVYNDLSEDDEVPEQYASLHEETLG